MSPRSAKTVPVGDLGTLSVVVPVFGQQAFLKSHIQHHQNLYRSCGETIWVVTPAQDGAHQIAKEAADHFGGRYVEVRRGLYEAWNTGIHLSSKKWIYLNTTGDFCDVMALEELLGIATSLKADVGFTPPGESKQDSITGRWPIFLHASKLALWENQIVPRGVMTKLQLLAGESNLLGSMAGAVFSADYLKQSPFRADFKSFGDAAWTYEHCATARFLYSKKPLASFLVHDAHRPPSHPRDTGRLLELLAARFPKEAQPSIRTSIRQYLLWRRYLNQVRGTRPSKAWLASPRAWWIRFCRQRAFARLCRLFAETQTSV